jgi:hypothetical protein
MTVKSKSKDPFLSADSFSQYLKASDWATLRSLFGRTLLTVDRYCNKCFGERRHHIQMNCSNVKTINYANDIFKQLCPAVFNTKCTQCDSRTWAMFSIVNKKVSLVRSSENIGSFVTEHTPDTVKFYLNEAAKSYDANACSAAATMYRSALEQILIEQGFKGGVLNDKLKNLQKQIDEGSAPKWTNDLDTQFLDLLRSIGNGSVHSEEDVLQKQQAIDDELLNSIEFVVLGLLELIYEQPVQKKN